VQRDIPAPSKESFGLSGKSITTIGVDAMNKILSLLAVFALTLTACQEPEAQAEATQVEQTEQVAQPVVEETQPEQTEQAAEVEQTEEQAAEQPAEGQPSTEQQAQQPVATEQSQTQG
jgi:outer membrane biosynthesis protein TonB